MIYQEFAQFYDDLFEPTMYDRWAQYAIERFPKAGKILDLACGTGRLVVLLTQARFDVTGSDISEDMLALASDHLIEAELQPNLVQADMRDLSEFTTYDGISCFDDSLCYLLKTSDLVQTFQEVYHHLKPGGKLLFDVISPYQTDVVYPGYMYNYQDDDRAFLWTSFAGEFAPHSVEHELSFFQYNATKQAFERYKELHKERTYTVEDYRQFLLRSGFTYVKVTTDFGKEPFQNNVKRWFFECVKGG